MPQNRSKDESLMLRALELSRKARVIAPPNPWVGCVIVNGDEIVGEGFTQPPGLPHAEAVALSKAKGKAKGATAYVTLEPCAHQGRTPPCAESLINAQITRVVIGLQDPDSRVRGRGIQKLREAGIEVVTGICSDKVAESLAPYLHHRTTGMPYCVAKSAISIDGRIAASDGTSKWISSPEARRAAHQLRAESQAILVGSRTALTDNPKLTVRDADTMPPEPPLRVVLDGSGRLDASGPLFDTALAPTLIVTSDACPEGTKDAWRRHGVEVAVVARKAKGVDLREVLELLGKRGILQLLIEGGGTVIGAFLEAELLQRLSVDIGPCLLGDAGAPLARLPSINTLDKALRLSHPTTEMYGDTVRITYLCQ